jgi:hypothetical protein
MARWEKGTSGNPRGKLKGTRNVATRIAQELLNGEAEGLARKAVEMALAGDATALRLCLERLVPPCKDAPINVCLPRIKNATALPALVAKILSLVAAGSITPTEGRELCSIAESARKTLELVALEDRVRALEEGLDQITNGVAPDDQVEE